MLGCYTTVLTGSGINGSRDHEGRHDWQWRRGKGKSLSSLQYWRTKCPQTWMVSAAPESLQEHFITSKIPSQIFAARIGSSSGLFTIVVMTLLDKMSGIDSQIICSSKCIHNCFKPFLRVFISFSPSAANKQIFSLSFFYKRLTCFYACHFHWRRRLSPVGRCFGFVTSEEGQLPYFLSGIDGLVGRLGPRMRVEPSNSGNSKFSGRCKCTLCVRFKWRFFETLPRLKDHHHNDRLTDDTPPARMFLNFLDLRLPIWGYGESIGNLVRGIAQQPVLECS